VRNEAQAIKQLGSNKFLDAYKLHASFS